MKKYFRKPNKKGFTLVECIVAVAVFGLMVMIVFMILTNARNAAVYANDTEEDLTQLIDNVVGDETFKKYNDENTLELNITGSSSPLKITYNVNDGYKSFVLCTNNLYNGVVCNHFANNTEFMGNTNPEDFTQTAYVCPICSGTIVQTLVCDDCGATSTHTSTSDFTYLKENGGYACVACGGTSVHDPAVSQYVDANVKLNISGIEANAISFGNVPQPSAPARKEFVTYTGVNPSGGAESGYGEIQANLVYDGTTNNTEPGKYTLTLMPNSINRPANIDDSQPYSVTITFPPHYKFVNPNPIPDPVTGDVPAVYELYPTVATAVVTNGNEGSANSSITVLFHTNSTASFEFYLENVYTGFPFEYYFNNSTAGSRGLAEFWFGATCGSINADTDGNIVDYSASMTLGDLH